MEQRLQGAGSVVVVHGLCLPTAHGIFPSEGCSLASPTLASGFLSALSIFKESLRPIDSQDCGQLEQVRRDTRHPPSPPVLIIPPTRDLLSRLLTQESWGLRTAGPAVPFLQIHQEWIGFRMLRHDVSEGGLNLPQSG